MKEAFFTLTPERIQYDKFWRDIRKRNRWLILLRYGAFTLLFSLIVGIIIFQNIFSIYDKSDIIPLFFIAISILLYNIFFHFYWNIDREKRIKIFKIHGLRFSLLQICVDFIALMLFIYFTGGVESPLYIFFIFHVIIGSLFLPGRIINLIIAVTLLLTASGAILEFYNVIPHHHISGWLEAGLFQNEVYLIVFFLINAITLFFSIYLANSIARQLYQREKDLTIAYDNLQNAEKNKQKYVMSVVHDLKTPIAAAQTYLNMILDKTLGDIKEEHLRPLERSQHRLENAIETINKVLQISRLKLDADTVALEDINIKNIIDEIFTEMHILFESKNLTFNLIFNTETDYTIQAEKELIKLAISNLISNSFKYTPNNGKVEVTLVRQEDNIIISIADTGIGIPDSSKDKIFQEFFRTPLSKKEGIEGTGLGMSIVKNIIEKYNGTINFKSPSYLGDSEHPGTEFICSIPLKAEKMTAG
ncbi:sensor histidine kinase [Bacteroidetes/Chlorobi group bacterium ChocPot_Mid]|nr:MAG: sensor histidine kinase [Bacteroidetes/Chlorobi group bacterium ChocPot_Mid]